MLYGPMNQPKWTTVIIPYARKDFLDFSTSIDLERPMINWAKEHNSPGWNKMGI